MIRRLSAALAVGAVAACASRGPLYEFGPTDGPLRYQMEAYASMSVETPDGNQASNDTVRGTVRLEVGEPSGDGRSVTAQFEALELRTVGDFGNRRVQGDELATLSYNGTLTQDGTIQIVNPPQTPSGLRDLFDPQALLMELLAPLPPDGNEAADSWPVRSAVTSHAGMTVNATFDGVARFAGDTIWNGQPARVIVSEGTVELEGRGAPPGAPGEIELTASGRSERRYLWDATRGVMLASTNSSELDGVIVVLDFDIAVPAIMKNRQRVELQR